MEKGPEYDTAYWKIINEAIDKLAVLTNEDFHGYRSEIWYVITRVIEESRCDSEPIRAVWEKYKHLDQLLSDEQWLDPSTPQRACLFDLWTAIKKAVAK